jgi:hypothetical protein
MKGYAPLSSLVDLQPVRPFCKCLEFESFLTNLIDFSAKFNLFTSRLIVEVACLTLGRHATFAKPCAQKNIFGPNKNEVSENFRKKGFVM